MHLRLVQSIAKLSLIGALLATSACNSLPASGENAVADAYRASGVVSITPYSRTIFSSNNF
jgi:hypothetical protein